MTTKNPLDERHLGSASEALTQALELQDHPSYRLSFADSEFLMQDELRPVRLQLEYLKPQLVLEQHKVKATVVVFGSARFLSPEQAALQLAAAQQQCTLAPDDSNNEQLVQQAKRQVRNSRYYVEAQRFAELVNGSEYWPDVLLERDWTMLKILYLGNYGNTQLVVESLMIPSVYSST